MKFPGNHPPDSSASPERQLFRWMVIWMGNGILSILALGAGLYWEGITMTAGTMGTEEELQDLTRGPDRLKGWASLLLLISCVAFMLCLLTWVHALRKRRRSGPDPAQVIRAEDSPHDDE